MEINLKYPLVWFWSSDKLYLSCKGKKWFEMDCCDTVYTRILAKSLIQEWEIEQKFK